MAGNEEFVPDGWKSIENLFFAGPSPQAYLCFAGLSLLHGDWDAPIGEVFWGYESRFVRGSQHKIALYYILFGEKSETYRLFLYISEIIQQCIFFLHWSSFENREYISLWPCLNNMVY